jgi:hypothetical protein
LPAGGVASVHSVPPPSAVRGRLSNSGWRSVSGVVTTGISLGRSDAPGRVECLRFFRLAILYR